MVSAISNLRPSLAGFLDIFSGEGSRSSTKTSGTTARKWRIIFRKTKERLNMREHIRILGILNIIMGGFVALAGIVVLVVMGSIAGVITASTGNQEGMPPAPIIAAIGFGIAVFLLVLAAPSIIGGWGLLKFRPWSRTLMIVISVLHLLHIPLGTALGVYGLWVLFSDESKRILASGGEMYVPAAAYPAMPGTPQQPIYPPPGV